jgi:hypothetical protein
MLSVKSDERDVMRRSTELNCWRMFGYFINKEVMAAVSDRFYLYRTANC